MNLHYSQTYVVKSAVTLWFYYLMNLHYSQTEQTTKRAEEVVLLPYEFTLLSNIKYLLKRLKNVLLPYEFTLLSNWHCSGWFGMASFTTL